MILSWIYNEDYIVALANLFQIPIILNVRKLYSFLEGSVFYNKSEHCSQLMLCMHVRTYISVRYLHTFPFKSVLLFLN